MPQPLETLVAMTVLDLQDTATPQAYSAEIVIVGAGAVGIAMAAELSRRGHDVLLLEAGGISLESTSQAVFANATSAGVKLEGLHSGRFRLLGGTTNFWGGQLVPFDPSGVRGTALARHADSGPSTARRSCRSTIER